MRGHTYGIAAAGLAYCWDVDGRATVAADYVLAVLAVAFGAANTAGVQRGAPAVRFLDDHETNRLAAAEIGREQVHAPVLHFADRDAYLVILRGQLGDAGACRIRACIDKICSQREDYN